MNDLLQFSCIFLLSTVAVILASTINNAGPHNIKGTIYRPLTDLITDFEAWYDPTENRSRIDYFKGFVKTYQLPFAWKGSQIYKIFSPSDGQVFWPDKCFTNMIENQQIIQPAIPINMRRSNSTTVSFKGHNCTLFSDQYNSSLYRIIEKYWVRYEYSVEIPVRYEKRSYNLQGALVNEHYFLDYYGYRQRTIDANVFQIDAGIIKQCTKRENPNYLNPMNKYVTSGGKQFSTTTDFNNFTKKYGKSYESKFEAQYRENIFHRQLDYIKMINSAKLGYKLAINRFAGQTDDEYRSLLGEQSFDGLKQNHYQADLCPSHSIQWKDDLPEQLDWRMRGFVTPVKDQQNCASSYIFAVTGILEAAYYKKYNRSVRLSEQILLDCAWSWNSQGCFGGDKLSILQWIKSMGGIPRNYDYYRQYSEIENGCGLRNLHLIAAIDEICRIKSRNEKALKEVLLNYGPVVASIDASSPAFKYYSNGVYSDKNCSSVESNHDVLIVGYGDFEGKPYWLVKNSWSPQWGINGYILMSREGNTCGILNVPVAVKLL